MAQQCCLDTVKQERTGDTKAQLTWNFGVPHTRQMKILHVFGQLSSLKCVAEQSKCEKTSPSLNHPRCQSCQSVSIMTLQSCCSQSVLRFQNALLSLRTIPKLCISVGSFLFAPPPSHHPRYLLLRITSVSCLTVNSFLSICLWLSLHCHVKVCSLMLFGVSQIPVCLPCYYSYLLACLPYGLTACLLANIWMCDKAVLLLLGATIENLCVVCWFQLSCVSC